MDKQATIGFILIGIVLVAWMWLQTPQVPPPPSRTDSARAVVHDSVQRAVAAAQVRKDTVAPQETPSRFFASRTTGAERVLTIKTDLYTATLTTRGGLLRTWELHRYLSW